MPVGAIEVFVYYRTGIIKACLDFHGVRSVETWPRYFVRYDRLWIDGFVVPEPIRNCGLGSQILEELDEIASALNVWKIQGILGKKDAEATTIHHLARFYRRHGYYRRSGSVEKLYDPPRKLASPKPCTTFPQGEVFPPP